MDIRIRESSDWLDAIEDFDVPITVTVTHVKGRTIRSLWAQCIELGDLIQGEDVTIETADGVIFIGTVDDVDDSTRGHCALVTFR